MSAVSERPILATIGPSPGVNELMAQLKKQADWLETHYPGAAASLWKGLEEPSPLTAPELSPAPASLLRHHQHDLEPHAGMRLRTDRLSHWRDGQVALRRVAAAC